VNHRPPLRTVTLGRRAFALGAAGAGLAATTGRARAEPKIGAAHLIKPGTLSMSMNPTLPPMQYVNDKGELQGMHVELGNAIAKWLGLEPEYQRVEFAIMVPGLAAKRWDMINTGIYWTEERSKLMYMVPTERSSLGFIVARGNPLKIGAWEDLSGHRVSVELGGIEERRSRDVDEMLKKAGKPGIEVLTFNNFGSAFQALRAGQVDAATVADSTSMFLQQRGDFTRAISGMFPQITTIAFADKTLADGAVAALNDLRRTGYYDELLDRYGILKIEEQNFAIRGPGPA
jgi:polar amino acid transport system substrate-binding protein